MKNADRNESMDRTYKPDKYDFDLEDYLESDKEKPKATFSED